MCTTSNLIADHFLVILPSLQRQFRVTFRHFGPEQRDDAQQEAIANAFVAFARLWQRGRPQSAWAGSLARYAIRHWFAGRRTGTPLNSLDITSPYSRRKHVIMVERIDRFDEADRVWRQAALADRRTPVPDQAAFRIDFPEWLRQLSRRDRRIALKLAVGKTSEVAETFRHSWARVSQLRREFQESWVRFHGELAV